MTSGEFTTNLFIADGQMMLQARRRQQRISLSQIAALTNKTLK
jgi:hypothetical protein